MKTKIIYAIILLIGVGLLVNCSNSEKEWEKAVKSNNYKDFESYLKLYPNSQHTLEAQSRIETITITGILIRKNSVSPIISCKIYLCEVGLDGKFDIQLQDAPQGMSDVDGKFSVPVKRNILSNMKSFIFIVTNCKDPMTLGNTGIVMSEPLSIKSTLSEIMVFDIGQIKINN